MSLLTTFFDEVLGPVVKYVLQSGWRLNLDAAVLCSQYIELREVYSLHIDIPTKDNLQDSETFTILFRNHSLVRRLHLAAVISSLSLLKSTPSRNSLTTVTQECFAMSNSATIKVIPNDKLYISNQIQVGLEMEQIHRRILNGRTTTG